MRKFLLDTNILLAYLRKNELIVRINEELKLNEPDAENFVSVVSLAEIMAIAIRKKYGDKKRNDLLGYLRNLIIVDIHASDQNLINAYVEIDAYSQGQHPNRKLNASARNMGKNDLWIAATAHTINATLITTDADFDHLANIFLQLKKYEI